ncbi:hypothetical protein MEQU1_003509 [Malassezia equina]|uniref:Uncharacterized protein n=1 Tax=Malassezia equina TaxID=1381935 RepID=A0AAF0J0D5_9BASI|nr:hypothetical protein MEQU1_003509 [Malassezia equina]
MLPLTQVQSQPVSTLVDGIVDRSRDEQFVPFHFWSEWLRCAAASRDVHDKLLAIAQALQSHHVRTIEGQSLWNDLPRLPWAIREAMDTLADVHNPTSFVNIHTFFARCAADGLVDTAMWAAVLFRELLEEDHVQQKEVYLAAMDAWMQYAGAVLYNKGQPHHSSSPICRAGARWKGPDGFSTERLAFWNERLDELGAQDPALQVPTHRFPLT